VGVPVISNMITNSESLSQGLLRYIYIRDVSRMTEIGNLIRFDTVLLKLEMSSPEFLEAVLKYVLLHGVRLFRSVRLTLSSSTVQQDT
jgi:hypothetical protein